MSNRYKVLISEDLKSLENTVSEYMEKGYVPTGGIFYGNGVYLQAMYIFLVEPNYSINVLGRSELKQPDVGCISDLINDKKE